MFATSDKIGYPITCPGCGGTLQVATSISRDEPVNLACPRCASVLRVIRELHGHRIRCTTCRVILNVSASPWKLTPLEELAKPKEDEAAHEAWQSRIAAAAAQQAAEMAATATGPTVEPSVPSQQPTSTIVASHEALSLPISPAPVGHHPAVAPIPLATVSPEPSTPTAAQPICPWVTPPELLNLAELYRQQGNCRSFACRCGEVLNTVYGAELMVRAGRAAKLRIYPDMVGVEGRQTQEPSLAEQGYNMATRAPLAALRFLVLLPATMLGVPGLFMGLCLIGLIGLAVGWAAITYPLVAIPAILGVSLLWIAVYLTLDYARPLIVANAMKQIAEAPLGSEAIRHRHTLAHLTPRLWRPGAVVELLRVDYNGGLSRRSLILLVLDRPLLEAPGAFGLIVELQRWREAQRRVYVLSIDQGPEVANQVAAAIGTVLGLTVGWGRFRFGVLRREAISGCYGG